MASRILVTGAAGHVGAVGRTVAVDSTASVHKLTRGEPILTIPRRCNESC